MHDSLLRASIQRSGAGPLSRFIHTQEKGPAAVKSKTVGDRGKAKGSAAEVKAKGPAAEVKAKGALKKSADAVMGVVKVRC